MFIVLFFFSSTIFPTRAISNSRFTSAAQSQQDQEETSEEVPYSVIEDFGVREYIEYTFME
jgi:hypothetical protein